ncbi:MAG: hypothetical protein NTY38_12925, partial [Acidobacteria bacterium]|nr:hypothetical protein [Acidobacteriota bacterium]
MERRHFLALPLALPAFGAAPLPAVDEPHFPSRLHWFVWRNWELANLDRMAQVARTTPERLLEIGRSMGLPAKRTLSADQLRRLYITVIRQNWHLLPAAQIIELLGWTPQRFAFTLKEDDFLDVKLGFQKPVCETLVYQPPTAEQQRQAAKLRAVIEHTFGASIHETGESLFQFVSELSSARPGLMRAAGARPNEDEVDVSQLWCGALPKDPAPIADVYFRFARWMESAMGVGFRGLPSQAHRLRPLINPELRLPTESYELQVSEDEVLIQGSDFEGLVRCFYDLRSEMLRRGGPFLKKGTRRSSAVWNPRYLYSYFALYGDPLTEPDVDPFPDGYLDKLAASGINGVWIQAVLNTLAPSKTFPEFGQGWEKRLRNLNAMVERARRFGIKIFLYLNEPRAMPPAFFEKRPHMKGASDHGVNAICTSVPEVREWIAGSLEHIVRQAPGIGGFFSITMSENHTNCFSHGGGWGKPAPNAGDCPRCSKRTSWETIGELITTFHDGVRRVSPKPHVIAWDWGWPDELAERTIPLLPKDVKFMSISEW